jgi:tetratricopeptide (TPR) repeat protein
MKIKIIFTALTLITGILNAQQQAPKHLIKLYNDIYTSISNGSIIHPKLILLDDSKLEGSKREVASYSPINKTITVGQSFLDLTRKFGIDSSNARAHVLSHELAHLFLNHGFASIVGTGFASKEINKELKKVKQDLAKKTDELEADQWAFFYSYTAGYKTNSIAPKLLDSIYKNYSLNDKLLSQYPTLFERKKFAIDASVKMKTMCEAFDFANMAMIHSDYNMAIDIYSAIVQEGFKSREIVSNLGTSYLLWAIALMDSSEKNFILPLQIDMQTRLIQENNRGLIDGNESIIAELLESAIKCYKQAISIDPEYGIAYLNMSMAFWLKKENKDSDYYLDKAKKLFDLNNQDKIKIFEAIALCNSEKIEQMAEGILSLKKLSDEGNNLAKVNLMLIQKTKANSAIKNEIPEWIIAISKTKLSENTQNAISLLDSTFSKDKYKLLSCKQVSGEPIYRKWKSTKEKSTIVLQYIFNDNVHKTISDADKLNISLICNSVFETGNQTYICFKNVILIIDSNNNVKYQLIKSL